MIKVVSLEKTSTALLRGVGRFKGQVCQNDVPGSDKAVSTSQGVEAL
jgi:hypothetical protein